MSGISAPPVTSDPALFYTYVGFYSGESFPNDAPDLVMFYKYDGDALVIMKQEAGAIIQVMAPQFSVDLLNPTGKYQELLRVGFESDGYHLVDARRGNWLMKLDGESEHDYENLVMEPNLNSRKIVAFLWSKSQSGAPYVLFPETYAPSMLTWINYMHEWLAPQTAPTVVGVGVAVNYTMNRLKLPLIPQNLIAVNVTEMAPTGTTKLSDESVHNLELLLQEEPIGFIEDDDDIPKTFEIPKRETYEISTKELMRIIQNKDYSPSDRRRYEIKTNKFDPKNFLLVFTLGNLYVHIHNPRVRPPTTKAVRKALSLDRRIPIMFLDPPDIVE